MADDAAGNAPARDPAAQKKYDAAMKKMDMGDFKGAFSAFKKFTEEYPDDAEGWYSRAECGNYASGMFGARVKEDEIEAAYTKAIELDDSHPEYYQSYGLFCISIGKYEEAEKAYNEAAAIDESMAPSLYSEFAIEYYNNVLAQYGEILDDPKARVKYAKKALDYMLKALDMGEDEARNLLN
ncbi:Tetratricopeptide repeat protein [Thermoplasmatales archaeon BRNA1]|nr:Tetratricopeptide repeat protein [Thermoplasmatales archaeon BRNA1]